MITPVRFVSGLAVGHGHAYGGLTGCTVFLGPFRASVEVRGLATGSRELGVLDPHHLVPSVDAILLTGGSAFGLAAADGVMAWLEEQGRGYDTGVTRVPIVPAAVIFDLHVHATRPDSETGVAACANAREAWPAEGRVGAGAGATVGKIAGPEASMPGGVGAWAVDAGSWRVGAVAVVNALGDVLDAAGSIVAGARSPDGSFLDTAAQVLRGAAPRGEMRDVVAGTNTTLAVVATDAPLSRVDLGRMARTAANALARRISPVHTPFDGDVVFAVSTSPEAASVSAAEVLVLGVAAQHALEEAITRAVVEGDR
ncbi:MAG TPA: P1 family peptidase [Longimicrobiales bacterium]|nr:P1 family peptidase [Longimicrobiales bacterium]